MKTIWKYEVSPGASRVHAVPHGAITRHVGYDPKAVPHIWMEVESDYAQVKYIFKCFATGEEIPKRYDWLYCGTFLSGIHVWHVYRRPAE